MKKVLHLSCFIFLFLCVGNVIAQTTIYVTLSGNGLKDGSSWSNAMGGDGVSPNQYLYQIITNAAANTVIRVGSISATASETLFTLPTTTAYYPLKQGVQVEGGYYDVNGTPKRELNGPNTTFNVSTAARTVPVIQSSGANISGGLYEGFTIRNAGSSGTHAANGGGVLITGVTAAGTAPVLNHLVITACYATNGGGVALTNNTASIAVSHLTMYNNSVVGTGNGGGGLYVKSSNGKLSYINASNNTAGLGGGIYIDTFTGTADSIKANGNTAIGTTGALPNSGGGGGIFMKSINGNFDKIEASDNTASGGMYATGGGIYLETTNGNFSNLTIKNNTSTTSYDYNYGGGGMCIRMILGTPANINVSRLYLDNNSSTGTAGNGGGLYVIGSTASAANGTRITFDNVTVTNNKAGSSGNGGGIYAVNSSRAQDIQINFSNVTVSGNSAQNGGGIYNTSYYGTYYNLNTSNNTATENGGGMYNTTATIDLPYLTAEYNTANGRGGGLYNSTSQGTAQGIIITNGRVNYNKAGTGTANYGGGMYNTTAFIDCRNMEIRGNSAGGSGGGIYNSTVQRQFLWNTLIVENYSGGTGGGIYNTTVTSSGTLENLRYVNTTIASNYAVGQGGGVFNTTATQWYQNCIVFGNYSAATSTNANDLIASYGTYPIRIDQSLISTVSNAANVAVNFSNLNPNNCDVGNNADPHFLFPTDPQTLSTYGSPNVSNAGNYRLYLDSYCIDKGYDNFIRPLTTYPWMNVDLDQYDRIQGTAVDMGAYEGPGDGCPRICVWSPFNNSNDWNDPNNWAPRIVPQSCTTVYIPGDTITTTYPYLKEEDNAICDQIYFLQGGEVGRQDLLTYNKAYVQYDFRYNEYFTSPAAETVIKRASSPNSDVRVYTKDHLGFSSDHGSLIGRDRWYMLSAPIKKAVSGDFAFGGYPRTFMMRFIVQKEGSYPVGQFTAPFTTQNIELKAGDGFAYWINGYQDKPLYREYGSGADTQGFNNDYFGGIPREYGVQTSNGLIQLPSFYIDTLLMSHRIAKYDANTGISEFYYYSTVELGIGSQKDAYSRITPNMSGDPANDDLTPFKLNDGLVNYNVADVVDEQEILIGNPFMSTIDFQKFYSANSGSIYSTYRIYNGSSYDVFHLGSDDDPDWTATGTIDQYIPPLQGFFVTLKANKTSSNLIFDVSDISVKYASDTNPMLRSAMRSLTNTIRIKSINRFAESEAIVGKRNGATSQYKANEDVYKLFSNNSGVPEVYTYAGDQAVVMNFIDDANITIPIGIRTKSTGSATLQLSGMDGYENKNILFVDKELNRTIDITGEESFEYLFENRTGDINGRFFIQIVRSTTGVDEIDTIDSTINVYNLSGNIMVTSAVDNPVKEISIYDMQGRLIYSKPFNDSSVLLTDNFSKQNILIVKIVSTKESKTVKILNR